MRTNTIPGSSQLDKVWWLCAGELGDEISLQLLTHTYIHQNVLIFSVEEIYPLEGWHHQNRTRSVQENEEEEEAEEEEKIATEVQKLS